MNYTNLYNKIRFQNYNLFYNGDISLLDMPKVAIVGTRKPNNYTKEVTAQLSKLLSQKYVIVSGGAMGVDAIAHKNAKSTIMVSPAGLDVIYPKVNANLIKDISKNHLIISEYENGYKPKPYTFLDRNKVVVDISEFLIITQADENSGSIRSFEIVKKLNKQVYVIPHRLGDSKGSNYLAQTNQVKVIWDIKEFIHSLGITAYKNCEPMDYNEAIRKYGDKLFEMELMQEIEIKNAKVYFL